MEKNNYKFQQSENYFRIMWKEENTRNQLLSKENTLVMLMTIREESPSRIPMKDIWPAWKLLWSKYINWHSRKIYIRPYLHGQRPGKSQMLNAKYANSLSTVCNFSLELCGHIKHKMSFLDTMMLLFDAKREWYYQLTNLVPIVMHNVRSVIQWRCSSASGTRCQVFRILN